MIQFDLQRQKLPLVFKVLYRPMLFLSLGLHGVFLMLPMPQQSKPKAEQTSEQLEITQLLAPPKKPTPQPSPVVTRPQRQQTPLTPRITPPPQQKITPPVIPQPKPSPLPTPQATPITPTPLASPTPLPSPAVSPSPQPTIEADNAEFQNIFGDVAGEVSEELGVDPSYFAQPELFFTLETLNSDEPEQKPQISRIKWISLKTPEQVFIEIEPQLKSSGLEITTEDDYGGGKVYKLQKGDFVKYLNLVPTATSIGTLVVIWNSDPHAIQ